jgi:hypothetical protein
MPADSRPGHLYFLFSQALVIAALATSQAAADDQELRWKFKPGDKLGYNIVQDSTLSAEGNPAASLNMRQEMDIRWDIAGVNEQGEAVVQQKFERVKLKMTLPMPIGVIELDSKSEEPPMGVAALLAPMIKAITEGTFELTITSRGEVKDVKIPEDVSTVLKNNPNAAALGEMATEEGFKKMLSQGVQLLPEKAVKPGDQWSAKFVQANPAAGTQTVETIYRYEGTNDTIIKLQGNGVKKSSTFTLTGVPAKLKYNYKSDAGTDVGVFAVYVIEDGMDLNKVGGVPEVMTQSVNENGETALHKDAGQYYLSVAASGNWEVTVEEQSKDADGKKMAVIRPELKLSIEGAAAAPNAAQNPDQPQPPPAPTKMVVKEQKSEGEVLFDVDSGRLSSLTLNYKASIDVAGQGVQNIDQKSKATLRPIDESEKKEGTTESQEKAAEKSADEKK